MKINYKLQTNDFLQYNLYEYSRNNFKKFKNKFILIYGGIFLFAGVISIWSNNYLVALFFILTTICIKFIVPSRLKDRFFDDNLKQVKEIDINRIYCVILDEDSIELSTEDFNCKYNINFLERIVEVKTGFYLLMKSQTIIIPKSTEINVIDLKSKLFAYSKKLEIEYEDSLDWKY